MFCFFFFFQLSESSLCAPSIKLPLKLYLFIYIFSHQWEAPSFQNQVIFRMDLSFPIFCHFFIVKPLQNLQKQIISRACGTYVLSCYSPACLHVCCIQSACRRLDRAVTRGEQNEVTVWVCSAGVRHVVVMVGIRRLGNASFSFSLSEMTHHVQYTHQRCGRFQLLTTWLYFAFWEWRHLWNFFTRYLWLQIWDWVLKIMVFFVIVKT